MIVKCKCGHFTNVSEKPVAAEAGYVCRCGLEHRKVWGKWCTITEDETTELPYCEGQMWFKETKPVKDKVIKGALEAYIDNKLEELLKGKI